MEALKTLLLAAVSLDFSFGASERGNNPKWNRLRFKWHLGFQPSELARIDGTICSH